MDAARWKQVQTLLGKIFAAPDGQQISLIGELCAGDEQLREEVYALWQADRQGGHTRQGIEAVAHDFAERALLEAGEMVGPFRILEEIGRGGMGVVYLAEREVPFQQRVAIKAISPELLGPNFAGAFARERQILASLEHPSIARILDGGESEAGIAYLVMEYVEGHSLGLEAYGSDPQQLVDHMLDACEAVAFAHDRLVVHGDLKPDNILVTGEQRVKLLDFGIAAIVAENSSLAAPAESAAFYSAAFASPEQKRGERLTPASDVYSLGLILLRCLREPAGEMRAILAKATAAEESGRYRNARELGADLRRWRERRAVAAYSSSSWYQVWAWSRRNTVAAAAIGLALLSLIGGLGVSLRQTSLTLAARNEALSEARRAEAAAVVAEQRGREAEESRRSAESALKQAEESAAEARRRYGEVFQLSTSLLADFYEPARAPDFPTTARKWMVDKAQERLAALSKENPADEKVREAIADAYTKVGDLLGNPSNSNLGDVPGAAVAYGKAEGMLASLNSPQAKLRRIQITMRRGDLATLTGQAGAASKFYTEAAQAWKQLQASARSQQALDPETGRMLALTLMKAAQGLILEGKFEASRPRLNESLAIIGPLAEAAPGNSRMQRTHISALSRLAYLERQLQRLPEAKVYLAECARIAERALRVLPNDSDLRQNATMVYSQLGLTQHELKNFSAAQEAFSRGLEVCERDVERDPRNSQLRSTWATLAENHALLLWDLGQRDPSLALFRRAVQVRSDLAAAPNAAQGLKMDAGRARVTYALRLMDSGEIDTALLEARSAIQRFGEITERTDFRVDLQHGFALYDLSLVLERAGRSGEAQTRRDEARVLLEPLLKSQPRAASLLKVIYEKNAVAAEKASLKP